MTDTVLVANRLTGRITRVDPRGWGFVASEDKPFTRIFFHWSALRPKHEFLSLQKGQFVSFELINYKDRGWRARDIEVL